MKFLTLYVRVILYFKKKKLEKAFMSSENFRNIYRDFNPCQKRFLIFSSLVSILAILFQVVYSFVKGIYSKEFLNVVKQISFILYLTPNSYSNVTPIATVTTPMVFVVSPIMGFMLITLFYTSFYEQQLSVFIINLKKMKIYFSASQIAKCYDIYSRLREIHSQIEDALSSIVFTLCAIFLSDSLYFLYEHVGNNNHRITFSVSYCAIILFLLWIVILCVIGSNVIDRWDEAKRILHDVIQIHTTRYSLNNNDILQLTNLLDCTKQKIYFTFGGVYTVHKEIILKTLGIILTYAVIILQI